MINFVKKDTKMSNVKEQLEYEYLLRNLYGKERRDLEGVSADAWSGIKQVNLIPVIYLFMKQKLKR